MKFDFVQSLFKLENKTAIITGAGGYFGKFFSETLINCGAKVILFGRGEKINEFSSLLKSKYGNEKVEHHLVDFYDTSAFRGHLSEAINNNENIDILINNSFEFSKDTGFNDVYGRIENISKEQWMRSLESGVYWHALATQVVGEKMKLQGYGSIINISSMYALVSPDPDLYKGVSAFNPPSYGAAKAAILAFTRYAASFYGRFNIRSNAIAAGAFPNVDPSSFNSPKDEGLMKRLSDKTVLKRVGVLDDLAGVIVFLSSDASGYITGQEIVVDGGWTIT